MLEGYGYILCTNNVNWIHTSFQYRNSVSDVVTVIIIIIITRIDKFTIYLVMKKICASFVVPPFCMSE